MKMNKVLATIAASALSLSALAAMSFSASAADQIADAYFIGSFGTESNWNPGENDNVSIATVDGDAQYECIWNVAEATNTGDNWLLSVVIKPVEGVDNFTTATFPELNVTLDEVWVDGVEITDFDASKAIDTNYYENGAGVTRVYIRGDWAQNPTKIIEDRDIESEVRVRFTVSGLGVEGTSNVTADPQPEETTTTTAAPAGNTTTTTTAKPAADGKTTTAKPAGGATTTTAKKEASAATGDMGIGLAVAAFAVAGAAAFVSRKKD